MRCGKIQFAGPAGQSVEIEANGEGELVIETHHGQGIILIRDTGLPKYSDEPLPKGPGKTPVNPHMYARIVAQLPVTWAVFPYWEHTEPLKPSTFPVGVPSAPEDVPAER